MPPTAPGDEPAEQGEADRRAGSAPGRRAHRARRRVVPTVDLRPGRTARTAAGPVARSRRPSPRASGRSASRRGRAGDADERAERRRRARPARATRRSIWRTTSRCGQPSAFSVPELADALVDGGERQQAGDQERAPSSRRSRARCRACRRGSWRRRASPPTRSARSVGGRHRRAGERRLDLGSRPPATSSESVGAHVDGVHAALAVGRALQLGELHVHVGGLAAERRLGEARRP